MATPSILLKHLVCALLSVLAMSKGSGNVSKEEYLKMKRYLRFINRPAVKSIQTNNGDIFDCVDIYKQPALDHPSLRNHTIQVECDDCAPYVTGFGLPDGGCPRLTVPIRRVQMEDLLRAGSVSKFLSKDVASLAALHKYALMRTSGSYYGTEAIFGLWNPTLPTAEAFSLAQLWLSADSGGMTRTIEAGWQVYPRRYSGSTESRFFIFWTPDTYNSGCYDLTCSGFMQMSSSMSPGMALEPVSTVGGALYDIAFYVQKDERGWTLTCGEDKHLIGYWPHEIFQVGGGFDATELVDWGGETAFLETSTYPPMGSGLFAGEGEGKAAYVKNIKLYDPQGNTVNVPDNPTIYECAGCYSLVDMGNAADGSGRKFFYGGPGGTTCTCLTTQASEPLVQVA